MGIYGILKRLITNGYYEENDTKKKLDVFLLYNRITQEQYEELIGLIEEDKKNKENQ